MVTASSTINSRPHARYAAALAASAFALVLGEASAAPVQAPDAAPRVVVRYDDLNLATHEGTLALYHRIIAAARSVCPREDASRELTIVALARKCQASAIDRAVHEVHSSQLAAIHASHTG
jgi:UrcA family protein